MEKTIRDHAIDFYEAVWNQGLVDRCREFCAEDVLDVHHGQRGVRRCPMLSAAFVRRSPT